MSYPVENLHRYNPKTNLIYDPLENARFEKLHRGEITEQEFFMNERGEIDTRENPGLKKRIRMEHNGSAYRPIDPRKHEKHCPDPPPHVKVAFEEILGYARFDECGRERLILTMHPHIPRWCLFEVHLDPKLGERGTIWRPIAFFCEEASEQDPAPDLMADRFLRHLCYGKNALGRYREPTRPEFEAIRRTDKKLHGVEAVEDFFYQQEVADRKETDADWEARTADALDYYWNDAQDAANRNAGSGQRMRSFPEQTYRHKELRYNRTEKTGYTLVEKKPSRAPNRNLAPYFEERRELSHGVEPFRRGRSEEELELARAEARLEKEEHRSMTDDEREKLRKLIAASHAQKAGR